MRDHVVYRETAHRATMSLSSFLFLTYTVTPVPRTNGHSSREVELGVSGLPYKWSQASEMRRKDTDLKCVGKTLRKARAGCHKEKGQL